jgi:hypothetical protein
MYIKITVWSVKMLRNLGLSCSQVHILTLPWTSKKYVLAERWYSATELHGVTAKKTFFTVTAVISSNQLLLSTLTL